MFNETYKLSNGIEIPLLGLGTWLLDDEQAAQAVRDAVSSGYRHIDTAQAYMNEAGIGEGIRSCGIAREELFITTKVAAEAKTYEEVTNSIDESLTKLGLDYIDLLIIHSPQPWTEFREENRYFEENKEAWKAMEDAYKAGKVKAIGLSNFLQDDIENILSSCEIKPMVNQILAHVSNTPLELIEFCQKNGILVEAIHQLHTVQFLVMKK
ncbi:aldo/keto reductase [Priestia aryabhattai]